MQHRGALGDGDGATGLVAVCFRAWSFLLLLMPDVIILPVEAGGKHGACLFCLSGWRRIRPER